MPEHPLCIYELLTERARRNPDAPALLAPGRRPMTYGRLLAQVEETVRSLYAAGIRRGDRVAVVLPNGPEMASTFLAVAAGATCAPLNPAYRSGEFAFYLEDLQPAALIVEEGTDTPAVAMAESLGIRVLDLIPQRDEPAGAFSLKTGAASRTSEAIFGEAQDVALVLHTSGTTSRPKLVPLTHANLCHSAENLRKTLKLTPSDRSLNIMPLFHIHGLVGPILSSVAAGASAVCTPGFSAPQFFDWLQKFQPTWYTAVPTMHQAVLARAQTTPPRIPSPLRFIRSCSLALPPRVMAGLEEVFRVPAIESYGMTEAALQITSNPLPPGIRKPGSAGLPAGPEVAIMDEDGALLDPSHSGEVVIRGLNVTRGYENNPAANEAAFTNGWFRTGDRGSLDSEGYLFLTARFKEIINRGGEKISPREVEEVLLEHPAVLEAVAFALPDPRLGEEVAASVVLHENSVAGESELQGYAAKRLADFKVPRRIIVQDEIHKGPTGKPQRVGMASKLGLVKSAEQPPPLTPPRNETEAFLAGLWCALLQVEEVGVHHDFFELGGESLLATQLMSRIRDELGVELPLHEFFGNPTIAGMATTLAALEADPQETSSASRD